MKHLKPTRTILQVRSATAIGDAHIEAVIYAAQNTVNVEYNHNGTTYEVIFNDLLLIPKKVKK